MKAQPVTPTKYGKLLGLWGGLDELVTNPAARRVTIVALSLTSVLTRKDRPAHRIDRLDVDRMSSLFAPTRTLQKLSSGGVQLTDTTRAIVDTFENAGRLTVRTMRTGETVYLDASGDRIDRIVDAVGGATVFAYAGNKIQSITDPAGRVTQLSVNGQGDLVSMAHSKCLFLVCREAQLRTTVESRPSAYGGRGRTREERLGECYAEVCRGAGRAEKAWSR